MEMMLHRHFSLVYTALPRVGLGHLAGGDSPRGSPVRIMLLDSFSIRLLPASQLGPDKQRLGEIRVGSFVERFAVYPFAGPVEQIADRWLEELRALLTSVSMVGLPTASNMAWVLYLVDTKIIVQQTLMLPGVGPRISPDGKVEGIPPHRDLNEDGDRISQWLTTAAAVSAFVSS
jgi:hypothetical protein